MSLIHGRSLLVQEQQRRQGLVVRGRRHLSLGGKPGEKRLDLGTRHVGWVAQAVIADVGTHPMHVGVFGAAAVVEVARLLAQQIQQPRAGGSAVFRLYRDTWVAWRAWWADWIAQIGHGLILIQ
jgi:hypothetical protein